MMSGLVKAMNGLFILILSCIIQYSRLKEVRDALDVAIAEMQKSGLDLKKVSAEHYAPDKDYVSISLLPHACLRMEEIVGIIDTTSSKLQEALDGPAPSDVEDTMDEWDWCQQFFSCWMILVGGLSCWTAG
jgi:hypothetical protein